MADAKTIAQLRAKTSAGMMACKKALDEANGDIDKAVEILRKNGAMKAAKKNAERITAEGVIATYLHHNKKLAAMVEVQCESDFVALNSDFLEFANDLAMQVAATDPLYISPDSVPVEELEKQRKLFKETVSKENKPDDIKEKIVEGKIQKWFKEVCLIKQEFIKDEDRTVEEILTDKIATIGEKIVIVRFERWEVGVTGGVCALPNN